MIELKPCPFCGGEAELKHFEAVEAPEECADNCDDCGCCDKCEEFWCVEHTCNIVGTYDTCFNTKAEAIEAWNTRHVETCENTHEHRWLKCSECGYGVTDLYADDEDDINEQPRYCPNCGRKVVGE